MRNQTQNVLKCKTGQGGEQSIRKTSALIFVPVTIFMAVYIFAGCLQTKISAILLFSLLAIVMLFPFQIGTVLKASKQEYGKYSLQSAFNPHQKMSLWNIFLDAFLLFAFAGLMSITVARLENNSFAPLSAKIAQAMPVYFDWNNIEPIRQASKGVVFITCAVYFLCNVLIGPIVEELFFRGYLTSKLKRLGGFAPLVVTVLFSLYHFWLPFNQLFRICAFLPAAWVAWKKKNIYIAIAFHCMCNLVSTIGFILSVTA